MKRTGLLTTTLLCSLLMVGCNSGSSAPPASSDDPPVPTAQPVSDTNPQTEGAAPDMFQVKFETSKGDVIVEVHRDWSPNGADRFHELVKSGFYDGCRFFRVVPDFMVQFGINGDPEVQAKWRDKTIPDDPVVKSNKRGYVTFAKTAQPDSRSTQIFINFGDNSFLDDQGFSPFGQVTEGMEIVDKINAEYGEQPNQGQIQTRGNEYLNEQFPNLDFVKKATILKNEE